jgi:nitrogen fixation protein FixH
MQTKTIVIISLATFFGVVASVNGAYIALSLSGQDGLVVDHEYNKALHYNDVVQQQKRQAQVGWQVTLTPPATPAAPVTLLVADKTGKPLSGASAKIAFQRPTAVGMDQDAPLVESGQGRYVGEVKLASAGQWDAVIDVRHGTERYQRRQRIHVGG